MLNYSQPPPVNCTYVYSQRSGKQEVKETHNQTWHAAPCTPITQINETVLGIGGKLQHCGSGHRVPFLCFWLPLLEQIMWDIWLSVPMWRSSPEPGSSSHLRKSTVRRSQCVGLLRCTGSFLTLVLGLWRNCKVSRLCDLCPVYALTS